MRFKKTISLAIILPLFVLSAKGEASDIQKKLNSLSLTVPLQLMGNAETLIISASNKDKSVWENAIGRAKSFIPQIQDTLKAYGLPKELAFATLAWSKMNNDKISEDGGSGFWQLRYVDAKHYGLHISSYVDERRNVAKASSAAAKYLKDLFREFNDWQKVLTAFHSGKVEVNKAIRMADGENNFKAIYSFLPEQYRSKVPEFIAAVYLYHFYESEKIKPKTYEVPKTEWVSIDTWSSLYQVAMAIESEHELIKDLNPIFKKDVIPHASITYSVRIPSDKLDRWNTLGDSVYTFPIDEVKSNEVDPTPTAPPEPTTTTPAQTTPASQSGTKVVYYTVRQGDYLGRIADIYDVGVSEVRKWNGIRGDRINISQKLKIYVPASQYSTYSQYNGYSTSQLNRIVAKD